MTPNRNQEQKNWFYFIAFVLSRNSLEETIYDLNTFKPVEDPGEKPGSFAAPPLSWKGRKKNFWDRPLPNPKVWIRQCKLWLKVSTYRETLNHSFLAGKPIFLSDRFFLKQQKGPRMRPSWGHAPFSSKSLKKKYKKKNVKFLSYMLSDWHFKGIFKTSSLCSYYVWKDLSSDINLSILWIVPALMYDCCDICR